MASVDPNPLIEEFNNPPRFADRVVELRRVRANEIRPNPHNWRRHPEAQSAALEGMLADVGFADAVIARETPEGLELIDGHLRQEIMGNDLIPVLVVDINEEEAKRMLVTLDPLAAMAETDKAMLESLLETLHFDSEDVVNMLDRLANAVTTSDILDGLPIPTGESDKQDADEMVVISLRMEGETWERLRPQILALQGEGVLVDVV